LLPNPPEAKVLSNDDRDPPPTVARPAPSTADADSKAPTFPSEAESLLRLLKIGAARSDPPGEGGQPGRFPQIPGYEIESELGRGGMGIVYKAKHAALRHTVAIKMILASAHAATSEVARFVAEAEAIAGIKHPNVVQVFDLGVAEGPDAGRPYFVMEFVDGGNLAAHLKATGRMTPRSAAQLIGAVARGVHAANDVGIVHRDLKPANILLSNDSKDRDSSAGSVPSGPASPSGPFPKVSDFGLAKRLAADLTRSQAVMGTPAYMAPEQAGGKAKFVGPQADVYALGVILYQCLAGAVPFEDEDPWSLIRKVLEEAPEPLRKRIPHVPRDLELICLKCLEKEPHHRYPTAAALADDLNRFLNNETVSVRPIGAVRRWGRWARKRPGAAALTVAAALLVVAVPALAVWVQGRLDRRDAVAAEAKQTAFEAQRAEAEAKRARVAAEELADERALFAIQNEMRSRSAARQPGWTAANLARIPRAVALAHNSPDVLRDLRSSAAEALLAADLMPAEMVAPGLSAAAAATDPVSGLVAFGEQKSWGDCAVVLIDANTGRTVRRLSYQTVPLPAEGGFGLTQDGTRALAFSPDGKRLFVGTRSSRVVRFDLTAGKNTPSKVWKVSKPAVERLVVSRDSKTVYSRCEIGDPVLVWDADTGKARAPLARPTGTGAIDLAVLPTGELLATGNEQVHLWTADEQFVRSADVPGARRIAVGPGSVLLMSVGQRLEVYDRQLLEPTDLFTDPKLRRSAHEDHVRTIAVHPSGGFVATAAGDSERNVKVWELASGRLVATVSVPGTGPIALAWSGDGGHLLASGLRGVERWRFAHGGPRRFVCATGATLAAATFAPDGRIAAAAEPIAGSREVVVADGPAPIDPVRVSDTGVDRPGLTVSAADLVVVGTRPGGAVWKVGTAPRPTVLAKQQVWCPEFDPDGTTLWAIVGAKSVRTFDAETLAPRDQWSNRFAEVLTGLSSIDALAVGRCWAAAGGRDGSVYLLDPTCTPVATFQRLDDQVLAVAFAPDDSLVVAGTRNGAVRLIRPVDKTELPALSAHPGGVSAVAISRDGTLLATGGHDQSVRLWKRSGEGFEPLLTVSDLPHAVRDLRFSPIDCRLLVLLAHEHAVRVWDLDRLNALLAERSLGW
jgi:WD40 repeat protein